MEIKNYKQSSIKSSNLFLTVNITKDILSNIILICFFSLAFQKDPLFIYSIYYTVNPLQDNHRVTF